jgi:chromosome segregation ATPase
MNSRTIKSRPYGALVIFIIVLITVTAFGLGLYYFQVKIITEERKVLQSELDNTKLNLETTTLERDTLKDELSKRQGDLETFDSLYSETTNELDKTENALKATEQRLALANTNIKNLELSLDQQIQKNTALQNIINNNTVQIKNLQAEVNSVKNDIEDICDDGASSLSSSARNICDDYS